MNKRLITCILLVPLVCSCGKQATTSVDTREPLLLNDSLQEIITLDTVRDTPLTNELLLSDIKNNLRERHPLEDSIKMSVKSRVRSVLMTTSMAAIGLLPAALSHGIGSESQRPLAIVIIGGLIGATFFTLFVFPLMVEAFYRRMLYDKNGKLVQRRL